MNALDAFLGIMREIPPDSEFLIDMDAGGQGIVPFKVAHIATDLVPLADKYLSSHSRIDIVGYDGGSISKENYPWADDLARWVEQGNQVRYLLLKPTDEVVARLEQQVRKLASAAGMLQVITLNAGEVSKREDRELLQRWETFHFISFDEPKQLWVEKSHRAGSTAEGCAYFTPSAAEESALWDMLTRQFEYVVNTYGKVILSAGAGTSATGAGRVPEVAETNLTTLRR